MKVCTVLFIVSLFCCSMIACTTVSNAVKSVASLDLSEAEFMEIAVQKESKNKVKSLVYAKNGILKTSSENLMKKGKISLESIHSTE